MRTTNRIECSGCGNRIPPTCEPDLVLRKEGSEQRRFFHERCVGAAQRLILADPALWCMTRRYVDARAN